MLKYIEYYKKCEEERVKERNLMYEDTERIREKIQEREKQIDRLKKKLDKREKAYYEKDFPNWIETIVKPLMHDLEDKTGLHGEIYGPFGLCCKTSIYLREDMEKSITEQSTLHITIEPPMDDGKIYYETGEVKEEYAKGSIGELNGMNRVMVELPDTIEAIVALLR